MKREGGNRSSHDSSIRTSIVIVLEHVNLGLNFCITTSPSSTCARAYNASRGPSSAVRFAKLRRASASYLQQIPNQQQSKAKRKQRKMSLTHGRTSTREDLPDDAVDSDPFARSKNDMAIATTRAFINQPLPMGAETKKKGNSPVLRPA